MHKSLSSSAIKKMATKAFIFTSKSAAEQCEKAKTILKNNGIAEVAEIKVDGRVRYNTQKLSLRITAYKMWKIFYTKLIAMDSKLAQRLDEPDRVPSSIFAWRIHWCTSCF